MDLTDINQHILTAGNEIQSLLSGRKSSATQARKSLLLIQKQTNLLRRQILEYSKTPKESKDSKESQNSPTSIDVVEEQVVVEKPKKKVKGK